MQANDLVENAGSVRDNIYLQVKAVFQAELHRHLNFVISSTQIFRIHKWCGLVACVLIAIQAVTGIFEAYREDIGQFADPSGMVRQSQDNVAPLSDVLQVLETTHPNQRVERIVFPGSPTGTYFVHLMNPDGEKEYASVDPGSAQILRSGDIWTFPAEAAARIHYDYTIGLPGMAIVAATGVLGLLMAVTGVVYWWPPPGRRLQQLRINRRGPGKFILRQLHRSAGVITSLLLSFSLLTGLVLAVYYFVAAAGAPTEASASSPLAGNPDINLIIGQAGTRYPDHDIRDIRFVGTDRVNVYFHAPERNPRAAHQVGIDPHDNSIVATLDADADTALWVTWLPLHSGESFGMTGKVLVTANALFFLALAFSGPIMWLNRVKRKRRAGNVENREKKQ